MPPFMWVALAVVVAIAALELPRRRNLKAAARWAMISRVSAVLGAVLRADTQIEDVARLVVPQFADWCTLHLLDEGRVRRVAVVHADPEIERRMRARFATVPFLRDALRGPAKGIRTGELDLQEEVGPDSLQGQKDPELLQTAG